MAQKYSEPRWRDSESEWPVTARKGFAARRKRVLERANESLRALFHKKAKKKTA